MAELGGGAHFCNLRQCSFNWKAVCDEEIGSVLCSPDKLMEAAPFMCGLPRQVNLTIKDSAMQASTVGRDALKTLDRTLRTLELAVDDTNGMATQSCMTIESFSSLVLPWTHSLQQIHLLNCNVLSNGESSLDSPGFFARFPCLVVLRLRDIVYSPELTSLDLALCKHLRRLTCTGVGIVSLGVTGCKALTYLDCWNNRLSVLNVTSCAELAVLSCSDNLLVTLDVTACPNMTNLACNMNGLQALNLSKCKCLTDLDCHSNQLSVLDLLECAELTELECNGNVLETLLLPATVELETMHCAYNSDSLVVLGGTVFLDLHCSVSTYRTLSTCVHSQVTTLELEGLIDWDMAGNVRLQELTCEIGPLGSITLTGCNAVEVNLDTICTSMTLLGREAVHKLTLTDAWCLNNMTGFTNLTDLHCNFIGCSLSALDFSVCGALRKVHAEVSNNHMVSINMAGCACLEELLVLDAYSLSELGLAFCVNLSVLTCTCSRLISLDASCCPLLTKIKFSQSHELITLSLHSLARLEHVDIDDCPKLQGM